MAKTDSDKEIDRQLTKFLRPRKDKKRYPKRVRKLGSPGFVASKHVRQDWDADDLMFWLEERARGYDGPLREILCSSASMIRKLKIRLAGIEEKHAEELLRERSQDKKLVDAITLSGAESGGG